MGPLLGSTRKPIRSEQIKKATNRALTIFTVDVLLDALGHNKWIEGK